MSPALAQAQKDDIRAAILGSPDSFGVGEAGGMGAGGGAAGAAGVAGGAGGGMMFAKKT